MEITQTRFCAFLNTPILLSLWIGQLILFMFWRGEKQMQVSKKDLEILIKEPYRIGTTDKYIQEGIVYLAKEILNGKKLIKW